MTNFFNKFKKPKNSFWLMHTFIWVSSTCKNLEKTNDAITRKRPENWATKERTGLVLQDPFGYHWGSIESGIGSLMWIYHCLTPNVHSKPFQGEIWEIFSCTNPENIRLDENICLRLRKTSWRRLDQDKYVRLSLTSSEDVFKTSWSRSIYSSWLYVFKTSSSRFQDVLQKKVFKTSSRRLQDVSSS